MAASRKTLSSKPWSGSNMRGGTRTKRWQKKTETTSDATKNMPWPFIATISVLNVANPISEGRRTVSRLWRMTKESSSQRSLCARIAARYLRAKTAVYTARSTSSSNANFAARSRRGSVGERLTFVMNATKSSAMGITCRSTQRTNSLNVQELKSAH